MNIFPQTRFNLYFSNIFDVSRSAESLSLFLKTNFFRIFSECCYTRYPCKYIYFLPFRLGWFSQLAGYPIFSLTADQRTVSVSFTWSSDFSCYYFCPRWNTMRINKSECLLATKPGSPLVLYYYIIFYRKNNRIQNIIL